jgi:hypothetical protein
MNRKDVKLLSLVGEGVKLGSSYVGHLDLDNGNQKKDFKAVADYDVRVVFIEHRGHTWEVPFERIGAMVTRVPAAKKEVK